MRQGSVPTVALCSFSLYTYPIALRLLGALSPEYLPRPERHSTVRSKIASMLPELVSYKRVWIDQLGCRESFPFEDRWSLVEDEEDFIRKQRVVLFNDIIWSHSLEFLARFDRVVLVVQELHQSMIQISAAHIQCSFGESPSPNSVKDYLKVNGQKMREYWNQQALGSMAVRDKIDLFILRLEDFERDPASTWFRLSKYLGLDSNQAQDWSKLTEGLPPTVAGSCLDPDLTALASEFEEISAPALELLGYCSKPGQRKATHDVHEDMNVREAAIELLRRDGVEARYANQACCLASKEAGITLIHIPARSGSKRLPGKNIAQVAGLPLIAYTIRLALKTPGVDRVIVNTDDEHFAAVAREHGAETPFLRPLALAGDTASVEDAENYALRHFLVNESRPVAKFISLYPTSLFRNASKMAAMIEALDDYPLVETCVRVDPDWDEILLEVDGKLERVRDFFRIDPPNGGYYKSIGYFTGRSYVARKYGQKLFPLNKPFEAIDVDTLRDLQLARRVAEAGLYDFGTALC